MHDVKHTYRLPSFEGQRLREETNTSTLNEKQYEGKEETWKRVGYKFPGLPALTNINKYMYAYSLEGMKVCELHPVQNDQSVFNLQSLNKTKLAPDIANCQYCQVYEYIHAINSEQICAYISSYGAALSFHAFIVF